MTDIVERLRFSHAIMLADGKLYLAEAARKDMKEAADEIERLKREYPYSELDMDMHVEAVTKDLRAEIERLRNALLSIANDPQTNVKASIYARSSIRDDDRYR